MYWPNVTQESVQPVEKSSCLAYAHSFPPYTRRCCSSELPRRRCARLRVASPFFHSSRMLLSFLSLPDMTLSSIPCANLPRFPRGLNTLKYTKPRSAKAKIPLPMACIAVFPLVDKTMAIRATRSTPKFNTLLIMPCLSLVRKVTQSLTLRQDSFPTVFSVSFLSIIPSCIPDIIWE